MKGAWRPNVSIGSDTNAHHNSVTLPLHTAPSVATSVYSDHDCEEEEERYLQRRQTSPNWTLDRGSNFYQQEREKYNRPSLLETGRHAGRSRIRYKGINWLRYYKHLLKRDFFTSVVHVPLRILLVGLATVYFGTFFTWGCIYYATWRWDNDCFQGFTGFLSALLYSIETQQTIGYGNHASGECWATVFEMASHCVVAVLIEALCIGVIFAKVSHPKHRGRAILISESAVIARRDGVLKFMFRIADIQSRTVIGPQVHVCMYTWSNKKTAEGERIPVQVEPLRVDYLDPLLLLPVAIEHTIDERSPLFGHTRQSLEALRAEIVVVFEGQNEFGDSFMSRNSYLPSEIHWGHMFSPVIQEAVGYLNRHTVDLARFHHVEPQPILAVLPPDRLSKKVVSETSRAVPSVKLTENTLVLSNEVVVLQRDGKFYVCVRLGDTYLTQMIGITVKMMLYRYNDKVSSEGELQPVQVYNLDLEEDGQMFLRYPSLVMHEVSADSPVRSWATSEGLLGDADSELLVTVSATMYATSNLMIKSKVYPVLSSVKWGHSFTPMVVPATKSLTGELEINWQLFHSTTALHPMAQQKARRTTLQDLVSLPSPTASISGMSSQSFEPGHVPTALEARQAQMLNEVSITSSTYSLPPLNADPSFSQWDPVDHTLTIKPARIVKRKSQKALQDLFADVPPPSDEEQDPPKPSESTKRVNFDM